MLIVDDDPDTRDMYCESLRAAGFHPTTATTGEDALQLAGSAPPAVVVTDLRLKGQMDGLELTRRLRADDRTANVRVIMLTGADLGDERDVASASGCDRFLTKPCLPETLATEIRRVTVDRISPSKQPARAEPRQTGERDHRSRRGKA